MAGTNAQAKEERPSSENSLNGKKSKDKKRKGKDGAVEALSSALKALTLDQQVATVLSKYAEMVEENRKLQTNCLNLERSVQQATREKDKVEHEHTKAVLSRSRLESLCRELQKQNKTIKEENLTRLKEEEERRKEVSGQFNKTLTEISHLMEENTVKNNKLRQENEDMAVRLKDLIVQMEARENHMEKVLKQRELEGQLADAKLSKFQLEKTEREEGLLYDKKKLLEDLSMYQGKLQTKSLQEIELRTQLNSYTEKYDEFQKTLDKSNEIFKNFKSEMDLMTKTIKAQEKETRLWKTKADSSSTALLQMFNERTQMEAKIETLTKQNTRLQSLCRALQQQVSDMRTRLRNQGCREITPPIQIPSPEPKITEPIRAEEETPRGKMEEPVSARAETPVAVANDVKTPAEVVEESMDMHAVD